MRQTGLSESELKGDEAKPADESLALAAALGAGSLARKGAMKLAQGVSEGAGAALSGVWMIVTILGLMLGVLLGCLGALAAPLSLSLWALSARFPEAKLDAAALAWQWALASAASLVVVWLWGRELRRTGRDSLGEGAERFLARRAGLWREALRGWLAAQERLGEFVFDMGQDAAARPWSLRDGGKALLGALLAAPGGLALGLSAGPGLALLWIAEVGRAMRIVGRALMKAVTPKWSPNPLTTPGKGEADEATPTGGWARRAALALAKEGAGTPAYAKAQRRALERATPLAAKSGGKRL